MLRLAGCPLTEGTPWKPAPDLLLHTATAMGWDPLSCVVAEDSPSGVDATLAAGDTCHAQNRNTRGGIAVLMSETATSPSP